MEGKMRGAILPGNSTVELREFEIPKPGPGEVLIQTKASTICGSDIRCIYREHSGKGAEGYIPGTIAGHEPCGIIVEEGTGLRRFQVRSGNCVSYFRVRRVQRLPPRLLYFLQKQLPARLRLAAGRRHG